MGCLKPETWPRTYAWPITLNSPPPHTHTPHTCVDKNAAAGLPASAAWLAAALLGES